MNLTYGGRYPLHPENWGMPWYGKKLARQRGLHCCENTSIFWMVDEILASAHLQRLGNSISQNVIHHSQDLLTLLIRPPGKSCHMEIVAAIRRKL